MMKKLIMSSLLLCCIMFLVAGSTFAVKPGTEGVPPTNPNGFPEGKHYNLNIHGKKEGFQCPAPFGGFCEGDNHTTDFGTCVEDTWKYSNSLFIPEGTVENPVGNIRILIETGKFGGSGKKFKTDPIADSIVVIDNCTFDDDEAKFQLPPAKNGYWVFFRALAKPGHPGDPESDPSLTIEGADVNFFWDKDGNVLLFFAGSLGANWLSSETNGTFTRSKGKSKAVNATGLFNFTGDICFFNEADCLASTGDGDCIATPLCCTWVVDHWEDCVINTETDGEPDPCPFPSLNTPAYCKHFDDEPIWNIADFVQFFYDLKNGGLKLLQVRFYPIPDDAV